MFEHQLWTNSETFEAPFTKQRNLSAAILLTAIQDYRSANDQIHQSAAALLYPWSESYREHLGWVLAGMKSDPAWMREMLDRERPRWDAERKGKWHRSVIARSRGRCA